MERLVRACIIHVLLVMLVYRAWLTVEGEREHC